MKKWKVTYPDGTTLIFDNLDWLIFKKSIEARGFKYESVTQTGKKRQRKKAMGETPGVEGETTTKQEAKKVSKEEY